MQSKCVFLVRGLEELRATGLGDVAEQLVEHVQRRHVALVSVERYVRSAAHFARWLDRREARASRTSVQAFLDGHLPRCCCAGPILRHRIGVRAALGHLTVVLRAAGRFDDESPPRCAADDEVDRFDHFLQSVCGTAISTRSRRRLDVGQLLAGKFGTGPVETESITCSDIKRFVTVRPRPCRPGTLRVITSSLRSYLRFLRLEGRCPEGLVDAVPRVAHWRLASIPAYLTTEEQRRFLASFDTRDLRGRRDRAMALSMIVLGLRAAEVVALRLRDVDWRNGRLHVPPTKTRRGRDLPLPAVVGRALAAYVRHGRAQGDADRLFLRLGVFEGHPVTGNCVRSAVRLAYTRAGLPRAYTGTHRLRHTAATRMATTGAGAKEIADILGHVSLDSVAIYAKVDLPRLRAVALPWPGRSR